MQTVVTNSTVDGVLIAVVLVNAAVVCVRAVLTPGSLPITEAPYTESRIDVPEQTGRPVAGARS
jgi:carbon starvation protein